MKNKDELSNLTFFNTSSGIKLSFIFSLNAKLSKKLDFTIISLVEFVCPNLEFNGKKF